MIRCLVSVALVLALVGAAHAQTEVQCRSSAGRQAPCAKPLQTAYLPSVGTASTYAYPASLTTDAQGRVSSVTAGSAPGIVLDLYIPSTVTLGANTFTNGEQTSALSGSAGVGVMTTRAGTIKSLYVQGFFTNGSSNVITIYKAALGSATHASTAATCTVSASGNSCSATGLSVAVSAGDRIIVLNGTAWTHGGVRISLEIQ
jgi:hypothetical protein